MFTKKHAATDTDLAMKRAFSELETKEVGSDEYNSMLEQIVVLHQLKENEKPSVVSPDTWAIVGANIAGILMIIGHEHAHVITTKAFSLLLKPR